MNPKRVQWAVIGVLTGRNDNWGAEEEPAPNRKIMCRFGCRLLSLNDVHTGLSSVRGLPSQALTAASSPPRRRLAGVSTRSSHCQDPAGLTALLVNRSEVLLCTRRAHKPCSHGALIHGVRTTQRLTVAAAPASSLLLSPDSFRPDHRACLRSRQEGRWATAPPAPQLRGPRSTTSPRSPASSSSWTRLVRRPRLAPAPPRTQHRSRAHPVRTCCLHRAQPTRWPTACLLLGRRRALETADAEVDDAGSTMPHRRRELPLCLLPV